MALVSPYLNKYIKRYEYSKFKGFLEFLLKLDKRERVTSKAYFSVTLSCGIGALPGRARQRLKPSKGAHQSERGRVNEVASIRSNSDGCDLVTY